MDRVAIAVILLPVALALPCAAAEPPGNEAPPLERLFFSPQTRQALDEARRTGRLLAADRPKEQARVEQEVDLRVDGVVVPSGGRRTVWINGRAVEPGERLPGGVEVSVIDSRDGTVRLSTPREGVARVKPGESHRSLLDEAWSPPPPPAAAAKPVPTAESELVERLSRIPETLTLRELIATLLAPSGEAAPDAPDPAPRSDDDRDDR